MLVRGRHRIQEPGCGSERQPDLVTVQQTKIGQPHPQFAQPTVPGFRAAGILGPLTVGVSWLPPMHRVQAPVDPCEKNALGDEVFRFGTLDHLRDGTPSVGPPPVNQPAGAASGRREYDGFGGGHERGDWGGEKCGAAWTPYVPGWAAS